MPSNFCFFFRSRVIVVGEERNRGNWDHSINGRRCRSLRSVCSICEMIDLKITKNNRIYKSFVRDKDMQFMGVYLFLNFLWIFMKERATCTRVGKPCKVKNDNSLRTTSITWISLFSAAALQGMVRKCEETGPPGQFACIWATSAMRRKREASHGEYELLQSMNYIIAWLFFFFFSFLMHVWEWKLWVTRVFLEVKIH
jgi:hypothetical protein